jgi:rhomboid protease GluP
VLAADGIAHRVAVDAGAWSVWVQASDLARAEAQLALWRSENPERAPAPAPPEPRVDTNAGYALALALVAFFALTGPWDETSAWFERGAADARRIVRGELWRAVTALTLHSDAAHVLGNAFSCAVFGTLVLRRFGPGTGAWLLLLSGALGNLATALWHGSLHRSVGASTALFGAIGILAGTELVRRRRRDVHWRQAWLPLAGGLGLLAMLGTGRGSDLAAHVFGLLAGIALGVPAAKLAPVPLPRAAQGALAAAALFGVAAAWLWAFAERVSAWL